MIKLIPINEKDKYHEILLRYNDKDTIFFENTNNSGFKYFKSINSIPENEITLSFVNNHNLYIILYY